MRVTEWLGEPRWRVTCVISHSPVVDRNTNNDYRILYGRSPSKDCRPLNWLTCCNPATVEAYSLQEGGSMPPVAQSAHKFATKAALSIGKNGNMGHKAFGQDTFHLRYKLDQVL